MFDPAEETEPNWDEEIAEDVKGECSKFGTVTFIHVDRDSKVSKGSPLRNFFYLILENKILLTMLSYQ